jgi:hypothetical protein
VRGKLAQLAGFVDQTGLFRPLFAVTYKLHLLLLPGLDGLLEMLHGTAGGEIQLPIDRL